MAGADRYETAAAVALSKFTAPTDLAVLATGERFPDALTGGPFAAAKNAPVLLSRNDSLPASTSDALRTLGVKQVDIIGGLGSKPEVELHAMGITTLRLIGADRYETAAVVSKAAFAPGVANVLVATGTNFPDALGGGAAGAATGAPILLTQPSSLPSATANELSRLRPGRITILGGPAAVSPAIEQQLGTYTSGSVVRLAGADRYATSALVSSAFFPSAVPRVYLATGRNYPDALGAGGVAGKVKAPVLLAPATCLTPEVRAEIDRLAPSEAVLLGGIGALSRRVETLAACDLTDTLLLEATSVGPVGLGTPAAQAVDRLTGYLGAPDNREAVPATDCAEGEITEVVEWADLAVFLGPDPAGNSVLVGYAYGPPSAAGKPSLNLRTARDVTVGSTVADLRAAYGSAVTVVDDPAFGPYFEVTSPTGWDGWPGLNGPLTSTAADGTVELVSAGAYC